MSTRALTPLFLVVPAALAGCNTFTGLGELEFTQEPASSSAGGGGTGGGASDVLWIQRFGDAAIDQPGGLAVGPGGEVALAGEIAGIVDFGDEQVQTAAFKPDAFVARFNAAGAPLSTALVDRGADDCARDAALDPSGRAVVLVGSGPEGTCPLYTILPGSYSTLQTRFAVRVLDPGGAEAATIVLCDACQPEPVGLMALAVDGEGNIYVAGSFAGTFPLGGPLTSTGTEDVLVVKLDPAGTPIWSRAFGNDGGRANATDIVVEPSGGVVVTGVFEGPLSFGPVTHTAPAGVSEVFLVRLDANGAPTWSHNYPNAWLDTTPRLAAASDGILITGDYYAQVSFGGDFLTTASSMEVDGYLAKLDLDGEHVWSLRLGEAPGPLEKRQAGAGIAVDAADNVFVIGTFAGSIDLDGKIFEAGGDRDTFIAKLDASGAFLSARHLVGKIGAYQSNPHIAVDATGEVVIAGAFFGDIEIGGQGLSSKSQSNAGDDIYAARLSLSIP